MLKIAQNFVNYSQKWRIWGFFGALSGKTILRSVLSDQIREIFWKRGLLLEQISYLGVHFVQFLVTTGQSRGAIQESWFDFFFEHIFRVLNIVFEGLVQKLFENVFFLTLTLLYLQSHEFFSLFLVLKTLNFGFKVLLLLHHFSLPFLALKLQKVESTKINKTSSPPLFQDLPLIHLQL